MSHEDRYGGVTARYYDAAYATLERLGPDAAFYRALAAESDGPVLEIGCGTGRVLAEIAKDRIPCTGLDLSPAMLGRLASRALPGVRGVLGDMRDFELGERFPLVYSAFRAFQHLESVEDQLACLATVRRHLVPGGRFAFDVFDPRYAIIGGEPGPEAEDLRFDQDGEQVVRYARTRFDKASQTLRVRFRYERSRDGRVLGDDESELTMRWFFRFELLHLMARAGFTNVLIHGDFDGRAVGDDTPSFVVVGVSPSAP